MIDEVQYLREGLAERDAENERLRAECNAIIEQCAREAETNGFSLTVAGGAVGATIAAAIRALKYKP